MRDRIARLPAELAGLRQRLQGTEHRVPAGCGGFRGSLPRAAFPAGVHAPAQDGLRITAATVSLQYGPCLPEERLAEIFRDLRGVAACAAPLADLTRRAGTGPRVRPGCSTGTGRGSRTAGRRRGCPRWSMRSTCGSYQR